MKSSGRPLGRGKRARLSRACPGWRAGHDRSPLSAEPARPSATPGSCGEAPALAGPGQLEGLQAMLEAQQERKGYVVVRGL